MPLHQKAFWFMSFFLLGIILASLFLNFEQGYYMSLLFGALFICTLFLFKKTSYALLAFSFFLGAGLFIIDDMNYRSLELSQQDSFSGVIVRERLSGSSLQLDLSLDNPKGGKIRIYADPLSPYQYGDRLLVSGELKDIEGEGRRYFEKEGVHKILSFPQMKKLDSAQASKFKQMLFAFRLRVAESFESTLPLEQSKFMTGITLGKSAGFSKEFQEKLSKTGTTHLIALSGYNITIISKYFFGLLLFFLARRKAFLGAIAAIIVFVLMTGAEPSVVRAAVMGILVLIADQSARSYSFKNAVVASAFFMTLFNPKVLLFDVGFQLSFFALLGIIYLKPLLERIFQASSNPGFFSWKENLFTTASAQLAVLPLLLSNFGFFSPLSILTNILILSFIPLSMLLGLFIFLSSLLSQSLALLFALPARLLLGYELGVIDFFSHFSYGFEIQSLSVFISILFYTCLTAAIVYYNKREYSRV